MPLSRCLGAPTSGRNQPGFHGLPDPRSPLRPYHSRVPLEILAGTIQRVVLVDVLAILFPCFFPLLQAHIHTLVVLLSLLYHLGPKQRR